MLSVRQYAFGDDFTEKLVAIISNGGARHIESFPHRICRVGIEVGLLDESENSGHGPSGYPYELRNAEDYFNDIADVTVPKDMLQLAEHILDSKASDFDRRNSLIAMEKPSSTC